MPQDFIHPGTVGYFRYWCQKVLPAVYDDSLSYYELLCKVSNYLNEVIELTNTQSDAITELQTVVTEFLEMQVDPYIEQLVNQWFEENQPEIITEINGLKTRVSALESDTTPYSYFKNHSVLFIGDSYTYGTGASDHGHGDTKRFSSLLAARLHATEYNYAVGSTGFCDPGSSGENSPFDVQVQRAANTLTTNVKNDIRLVVIAGGFNDWNEGSTYGSAEMQSAANRTALLAAQNFPNALILVVPMLFKGYDANARLWNFENAIINGVGGLNGVTRTVYIRGAWTWNWGMYTHFAADKFHPNDLGHETIASQIYANIFGGVAYENRNFTIAFETGVTSSVEEGGYVQFYNGQIISQGMRCYITNAIAADTPTKLGQLPEGCTPRKNVSMPFIISNKLHGVIIITTTGAIYINSDIPLNGENYLLLNGFSYLPQGIRS